MARFLLVHGAWQGAWCWREVVERLTALGHEVVAVDLPGHGDDPAEPGGVYMEDYIRGTVDALERGGGDTILVGHSMGGVVSQAGEAAPELIRALVYVAALVPADGGTMMDFVAGFDPEYLAEFQWADDGLSAGISAAGVRRFLYSNCPADVIEAALPRFRYEGAMPFRTPLRLTGERYGRLRRFYIECLRDRVTPIALQRSMQHIWPFAGVYSIDTDHAPFLSAPAELTAILDTISKEI
ncbi:MAG: alpha/beta fold hydrolase [Bryobacteraceae bacterium]|nr:alpha/beta fold hydrolase [Bryobacteraceae bacterium]